jgi:ligand-binding SRPBCC domain-containing protein
MATLKHQIKINAPLEKVWGILTDLEQVKHYNTNVDSVSYTSENKTGVGSSRHCNFKGKGFAKERVTAVVDKKSVSMEIYESDMPMKYMRWTNSLVEQDGQTVMTATTDFKMKFGLLGTLMEKLMVRKKFDSVLTDLYNRFKDYSEKK